MRHLSVFLAGAFLTTPLYAQDPAQRATHAVRGVVFDSVAAVPLAGATVQVRSRDSLTRVYSATTDATGHFRVAGLPPGRFLIGFYHDALTALGLDTPLRTFEVKTDTSMTVNLAIPPAPVVLESQCGRDSAAASAGMLAGFVRDAQGQQSMAGSKVFAEWRAIAVDTGKVRAVWQHTIATVGDNGTYLACGVPVDASLNVRVLSPGHREIAGPVNVPGAGVARRDFALADSAATTGAATLRGRVVHDNGKPVTEGRVGIGALALEVPTHNGEFSLAGLPAGTWLVSVKVIGSQADSLLIDITDSMSVAQTITVSDRVQQLGAVAVVGERNTREARILDDVRRRQRIGVGNTFLPGNTWFDHALYPADVVRVARGFQYIGPDSVIGRQTKPYNCGTAVYLNGMAIASLRDLNAIVSMSDVIAIETYPDMLFAPPQWRNLTPNVGKAPPRRLGGTETACSLLLVWTKHG